MKTSTKSLIEWHEKVFPENTLEKQIAKFKDELAEFNENHDVKEFIDIMLVSFAVGRFDIIESAKLLKYVFSLADQYNIQLDSLKDLIDNKMEINYKRVWDKQDGKYQHREK